MCVCVKKILLCRYIYISPWKFRGQHRVPINWGDLFVTCLTQTNLPSGCPRLPIGYDWLAHCQVLRAEPSNPADAHACYTDSTYAIHHITSPLA